MSCVNIIWPERALKEKDVFTCTKPIPANTITFPKTAAEKQT